MAKLASRRLSSFLVSVLPCSLMILRDSLLFPSFSMTRLFCHNKKSPIASRRMQDVWQIPIAQNANLSEVSGRIIQYPTEFQENVPI